MVSTSPEGGAVVMFSPPKVALKWPHCVAEYDTVNATIGAGSEQRKRLRKNGVQRLCPPLDIRADWVASKVVESRGIYHFIPGDVRGSRCC